MNNNFTCEHDHGNSWAYECGVTLKIHHPLCIYCKEKCEHDLQGEILGGRKKCSKCSEWHLTSVSKLHEESMSEIKRYEPAISDYGAYNKEDDEGRYVLFSDHEAVVKEKDRQIEVLVEAVKNVLIYAHENRDESDEIVELKEALESYRETK